MARIPTIQSEASARGVPLPSSDPTAFGVAEGAAIANLGQEITRSSLVAGALATRRLEMINQQWASEAYQQEVNSINKWMADPENNSKDTFSDDLMQLKDERLQKLGEVAPNKAAFNIAKERFGSFINSRYQSALITESQTRITNMQSSIQSQINDAVDGYRVSRDIPNVDASADLEQNLADVSASIDAMLGDIAPTMAQNLKDQAYVDAVYAVMDDSPDFARQLLDKTSIEGPSRKTIERAIDSANSSKNAADVAAVERQRQNHLVMVERGKTRDKLSLTIYQSIYSRDRAQAEKAKDDALIDIYNDVNDADDEASQWAPAHQVAKLQEMLDKIGSDPGAAAHDEAVYQLLSKRISDNLRMIDQDPVGYLAANNGVVSRVRDKLASLPENSPERDQYQRELYDLIVRYQGAPKDPGGLAKDLQGLDDAKMYLNVPRKSVHVMSSGDAAAQAAKINQGSPKEALKSIASVLSSFPEEYQAVAFNDLVTLPGSDGIRSEYWAAAMNSEATWINDYLGVIQNADAIRKTAVNKESDFDAAINTNPTWLAFMNPASSDNFQNQHVVSGFRNGIMLYAMGLHQRGSRSPKEAVELSVNRILGEQLGTAEVNGKVVIVPRVDENRLIRSDAEIEDIGRRLQIALEYVPPGEIKMTDEFGRSLFPALEMAGTEKTRQEALADAIRLRGTFQMTPDGRAAVLYYDDGLNHFELRDKNDRAFMINLTDLPAFAIRPAVRGLLGFNLGQVTERPPVPGRPVVTEVQRKPTKSDDPWSYAFTGTVGTGVFQTNWPSMPDWIKRGER